MTEAEPGMARGVGDIHYSSRERLLALGIVVLAALLRWVQLAEWDMWTDEVQTLWISVTDQFIEGPMYSTAPVNFWLTKMSVGLLGEGELGLRFVPFLAGVATVAVFLWSMPRFIGRRAALLGGLVLALSMWHVSWSQTGRHFSLQTLLVLIALHFFLLQWLERRAWAGWVSAAFLLCGIFTHSSTMFYLGGFLAFLGLRWLASLSGDTERSPRQWLLASLPYFIALAIYFPVFFGVGTYLMANKTAWNPPWNIVGSLFFYLPPWLVLPGLAGGFVLAVRDRLQLGILFGLIFIVPVVLVTAASALTIASAAYCLAGLPALAALIGCAGDELLGMARGRAKTWAVAMLLCGLYLSQGMDLAHYYLIYNGLKPRWQEAAAYVEARRKPEELVFSSEGDVAQYYLGRQGVFWIPPGGAQPGAWYIISMAEGVFSPRLDEQYQHLLHDADLAEIFPLHYGAKDRTLGVFYAPPR